MIRNIIVEQVSKPIRLDKYLREKIKDISREKIIHCIKQGKVKIEGKNKVKPSFILKGGERILLEISNFLGPTKKLLQMKPQPIFPEPKILYEDRDLIIINKPAGIIVHPHALNISEPSIAGWLIKRYPQIKKVGEDSLRPGIVHRLDKDTSGVLVIAKNQSAFYFLKQQFQGYKIKKKYLALVRGEIKKQQGTIDLPLIRSTKSPIKRKVVIKKDRDKRIKTALTKYKVLKQYQGYTLLRVFPQTGRTHQIRVHLASTGFPVVGDKLYGRQKKSNGLNLTRHFLHAQEVSFFTSSGEFLQIEAPLPEDLNKVLQQLKPKID